MIHRNFQPRDLQQQAHRVVAHPWTEKLARFSYVAKGTVYFVVGLLAAQTAIGRGGETTSRVVRLHHLYNNAYKAQFMQKVKQQQISSTEHKWVQRAGQLGIAALELMFSLIGIFLIVAAWQSKASQARDFGRILATLEHQPFGSWLLDLMALGLMAYHLYAPVEVRYRRIVN